MELALGGSRAMYTRALANCGVDTGGTLTGGLWLHDLAGRHDVGATSLVGAAQAAGGAVHALLEVEEAHEGGEVGEAKVRARLGGEGDGVEVGVARGRRQRRLEHVQPCRRARAP